MIRIFAIIFPLLLSACSMQKRTPPNPAIDTTTLDENRAFKEVESLLEIHNRDAGTAGAEKAAQHIFSRLKDIGIHAEIDTFEDSTPRGKAHFHNVIGHIPGRGDDLILIGSHFDTKAGMEDRFQGANDSGSSTGLLIELARVLKMAAPLQANLQLVFFDGEECLVRYSKNDGLHGSRHHASKLVESGLAKNVKAVIIMDMVGDRDLYITFPRNSSPELLELAFRAARAEGTRDKVGLHESSILDDHVPFLQAGMPVVNFIDFNYGSHPQSNDYWHTAEDTIDKISAESLGIVGRMVLQMLNLL